VLINLVGNAIKNTSSGSVTLSTQKENDAVHISVQDTGKGIPAEDLDKLFIPFERVNRLHEQETGSTGLGWLFLKNSFLGIMEDMGGVQSWCREYLSFHFTFLSMRTFMKKVLFVDDEVDLLKISLFR